MCETESRRALLERGVALGASLTALGLSATPSAQPMQVRVVRIAELEIDPAQLEIYRAALREEIQTSIRVEPGVLTLAAVSVKGHPAQIRIPFCSGPRRSDTR